MRINFFSLVPKHNRYKLDLTCSVSLPSFKTGLFEKVEEQARGKPRACNQYEAAPQMCFELPPARAICIDT